MSTRAVVFSLTLLAAACAACTKEPSPPAPASSAEMSGHARMVEALAAAHRRTGPENRFLGDGKLVFLMQRLDALPIDAPAFDRCRLELEVGRQELRLGRTEVAIEHFQRAEELVESVPASERTAVELTVLMHCSIASLRLGENQNCVKCADGAGCMFPIEAAGVHEDPAGSRGSIPYLLRILEHGGADEPTRARARWLLNIACMTIGGAPDEVPPEHLIDPALFRSAEPFARFENAAFDRGLATLNHCGAAVIDDFDGDGAFDIMTAGFELDGEILLFMGRGDGTFDERGAASGLEGFPGGLNMIHADVDDDGDLDVYVLRGAWLDRLGRIPNSLLANDGRARFQDVTFQAGLSDRHEPTQTAAFADYDNDGDLDLYVGNENAASQLFRNTGDGTFEDVAAGAGVENHRFAKAVVFGDYDGDRFPDLFVSNDFGENRLYRNRGDGTFEDVAETAGVAGPTLSFPAWFWDFDNDGALDIYVSSYVEDLGEVAASYLDPEWDGELGRLYRGDGAGRFENVTVAMGLNRLAAAMGANFGDLDNDGWLDFYLGTGWPGYEALVPNVMYRNRGGTGFSDVSAAGGFGHLQKGHAIVFADVDGDGDQDVFEQMGGAYAGDAFHDALYVNPGHGNHWLSVELVGVTSNRSAIGARIRADFTEGSVSRSIYRHVNSGGSFGSNPLRQHLGLGGATRVDRLEICWPTSGRVQVFEDVAIDRSITIREDQETPP